MLLKKCWKISTPKRGMRLDILNFMLCDYLKEIKKKILFNLVQQIFVMYLCCVWCCGWKLQSWFDLSENSYSSEGDGKSLNR